jgi:hypothetical protein
MIMDKAAIFAEVTKRNALRRANFLPPLDVRAECAHQVAVAAQRDHQALYDEHADEREVIRQEVLTELRARHGVDFGHTMGGRWAVGEMTRKRFAARMARRYGMVAPEGTNSARNKVIYGEVKKGAI